MNYRLDHVSQQAEYVGLLEFLRAELCVKHSKMIFFRTWDTQVSQEDRHFAAHTSNIHKRQVHFQSSD